MSKSEDDFIIKFNKMILFLTLCLIFIVVYFFVRNKRKQLQQRFFAFMLSKSDSFNLSLCLEPYKSKLFSSLNQIISHDQQLADEGIGCIRLLEIGIGSGNNLKFYPNKTRLISVEPNSHFETYFEKNRKKFPNIILEKSIAGTAEDMSTIADNSIDVVVSTHVLCSVSDIKTCLSEIKRVLIPNGKFIYVEHVAYESGTFYRRLQSWVQWIWKIFNDDCRLTVETSQLISEAEFSSVDQQYCIVNELSISLIRPHIFGIATK